MMKHSERCSECDPANRQVTAHCPLPHYRRLLEEMLFRSRPQTAVDLSAKRPSEGQGAVSRDLRDRPCMNPIRG